jgi:hypothetical protein
LRRYKKVFKRGGLQLSEVTFCAQCSTVWREGAAAVLGAGAYTPPLLTST